MIQEGISTLTGERHNGCVLTLNVNRNGLHFSQHSTGKDNAVRLTRQRSNILATHKLIS
jgi:hypothetical protein